MNLPIDAAAARDREISERTKGYAAGWSYRCPCGLQVSQLPEWDDVARLHDRHGRRCELAAAASDPKPR